MGLKTLLISQQVYIDLYSQLLHISHEERGEIASLHCQKTFVTPQKFQKFRHNEK